MEWLHQGCDSDMSLDFHNFGAGDIILLLVSAAACVRLLSIAAEKNLLR